MQNLKIRGREYTVEETGRQAMPYILTGARGAAYGAVRALDNPSVLRLVGGRSFTELRIDGNAVRLTDADGELREDRVHRMGQIR